MNIEDTCGSEQSSIEGSHKSSVETTNKKQKQKKKRKTPPTCTLCRIHGIEALYLEGHKTNCPGQYCMCSKCDEKRKAQKHSAAETRKTRARDNKILVQERQQTENPSLVLIKGFKEQVPFLINSANKLLIENWRRADLLIEEVAFVSSEEFLSSEELKTKKESRKRKANQQKKNVEEIIFPKDLEHLLQHTVYSCCPIYDIRIINLVNEIVATILQYRSTADAEITLNNAKDRISFLMSEIRRLQYELWYSIYHQSSNTVGLAVTHGRTPSYTFSHLNGPERLYGPERPHGPERSHGLERPHGPERPHEPERPQGHPYTFPYTILNQYTSEYALTSHLNLLHSDLLHITNRLPVVSEVEEPNPKKFKPSPK